jgi:hypothetical protein
MRRLPSLRFEQLNLMGQSLIRLSVFCYKCSHRLEVHAIIGHT